MDLKRKLLALRPQMASAAQAVLDDWTQDEDGYDEELGGGGACDRVSDAMRDVVAEAHPELEFQEGGQDGDDHAFFIAYDTDEAFAVDVHPSVYETGGGYSWRKVDGAEVGAGDVAVWEVERELVVDW